MEDCVLVKVKFKGSKLATGSSKMPNAVVNSEFMENLTTLNLTMIENSLPISLKMKKPFTSQDSSSVVRAGTSKKRKLGSATSASLVEAEIDSSAAAPQRLSIDAIIESDRRLAGLCLPILPASTSGSEYYAAAQGSRKQLQKMVEGLSADFNVVNTIPIKCDYDFWLWIEAQNVFAPFSYKTHDVSVLALEDIGRAEVLQRWCMPPLKLRECDFLNSAVEPNGGVYNEGLSERVSEIGIGLELNTAGSLKIIRGVNIVSSETSSGNDSYSKCNSNDESLMLPRSGGSWARVIGANSITSSGSNNCASSSSRKGSSEKNVRENAADGSCGVDDSPDEDSYPYFKPHPADYSPQTSFGLDEHLVQLEKKLNQQILANNERKASLRRCSLQESHVRCELDQSQKAAERDKALLTRWRKSKAYIPVGGRTASNNGQTAAVITGKSRPSQRKKLGGY